MAPIDVISANLPILRELRNRIGQLELAQRVDVSRRTIARLENAEVADPGVDLMRRIAKRARREPFADDGEQVASGDDGLAKDVCDRLASAEGPEILEAMVRAARHPRRSQVAGR